LDLFLTGAVAILLDGLVHYLLAKFTARGRIHVLVDVVFEPRLRITKIQAGIPCLIDGGHLAFVRASFDVLHTIHFFSLQKRNY
jgi:hypothetical protein